MSGTHLVVWQLSDGKRGHERQVEGLLAGLARQRALDVHRIAVARTFVGHAANALARRFPAADGLPDPALVIAADVAFEGTAAQEAAGRAFGYHVQPTAKLPLAAAAETFQGAKIPIHQSCHHAGEDVIHHITALQVERPGVPGMAAPGNRGLDQRAVPIQKFPPGLLVKLQRGALDHMPQQLRQ